MEADGGGGGEELEKRKTTPEREPKVKRKMKTASQLEILENTYAMGSYPSEAIRAELSVKLGLSDRQLQMWFCHRRLKDRKPPPEKKPRKNAALLGTGVGSSSGAGDEILAAELGNEHVSGSVSGSSPFQHVDSQPRVAHRAGTAVPRIAADMPAVKRYYEPPQAISELRAIAFVEAQLGEPLREDGPILGMEFDPLPPGAFGTPIEQQKPAGRSYESKLFERPEVKPIKGSGRAVVHEYQFLPEQPSVRSDSYERAVPSHYYANDAPNARTSLPSGRSLLHGTEAASSGYGFQGHMPSLSLMPPQARQGHLMPSAPTEFDIGLRKQSYPNVALDAQFGTHPITGLDNPLIPPDKKVFHEEDVSRMERKRKSEEARIAREVEAHEKRIRKELEKQDILRRKREEQMRKEMERQDRERRKEEERLLREKQREEERYLREQRREMERREKFLQKESIRAEKLRLKEEMRREKEAARIKAAHDRAAARRIAKESMEPIDDERLELMEIAASSRGLPSMLSLDGETLQNIDLFRDMLVDYPPKSVHLKRPFAIQPWADSEENTGNLLMVWRFLITFADVIGLWPFTLDEFVQAFHDYDPRLLGEIHIALLKSIIKDIEDVARTPSSGLGANQNSAANPGGGHPQIVEGAFAWGFDIGSWQRHLNPLTWPEILRQFALSAGFGPKLKKRNIEQPYLRDENEGNDGEDIISNLRNGAAAENAAAIMQERGYSNPRRSRHRLTPGTVKFAAFHVLSLEGGKGLTILEVAEKIQKSGLRDLTTSKTPEASIAAALSRDTKLFERTAPSTYCVRAPYRKDPADADAILSAAREKVQVFKNGYLEGEDADDVEKDDAEREEDSDSDAAEDPEIDDLGAESKPKKEALIPCSDSRSLAKISTSDEKDGANKGLIENPQVGSRDSGSDLALMQSGGLIDIKNDSASVGQSLDIAGANKVATNLDQEESVIDESNSGEPWVQGLMEGEYSDLSVEERLNALVALIGEANEGNSIRIVLEERLEAANALKKQMWAEAQLDKRRMKEEYAVKMQYPSFYSNKAEQNPATNNIEGRQSPLLAVNEKNYLTSNSPAVPPEHLFDQQVDPNYSNNMPAERNIPIQDSPAGPDNFSLLPSGYVAEKSRPQFKAFIGHKAEEMYVYRSLPLGQDRRRNRYWQFMTSASRNDPGSGRIFIELHDGCWRLIDSEEAFDALLASLDVRGIRESHLHLMLQKIETSFKETVKTKILCTDSKNLIGDAKTDVSERACDTDWSANTDSPSSSVCLSNSEVQETSSSFRIGHGRNCNEKNDALKRYLDFEKWMWEDCFDSSIFCAKKYGKTRCKQLLNICNHCHDTYLFGDHHCSFCHKTYNASISRLNFSEHVILCKEKLRRAPDGVYPTLQSCFPLRIRLLKAHLATIEVSIPAEALEPSWSDDYRKFWIAKLQTASSAEELFRILTLLEGAIRRDFLLPNYETTSELLGSSEPARLFSDSSIGLENLMVLPWVPLTISAVTLRLLELDSSICYVPDLKAEYEKKTAAGAFLTPPSKYAIVMNNPEDELAQTPAEAQALQQEPWGLSGSVQVNLGQGGGRGRGRGRTRGGKSQKKVKSSRLLAGQRTTAPNGDKFGVLAGWKGNTRVRGGRRRGRRSMRSRHKPAKKMGEIAPRINNLKEIVLDKNPRTSDHQEWNGDETAPMQVEVAENANSPESSEYDEDNGQGMGDEYYDVGDDYSNVFNGKAEHLVGTVDYSNVFGGEEDYRAEERVDDDVEDDDEDDDDGDVGDDVDEDELGDVDVEEYFNGDSDEEGNGEIGVQIRNQDDATGSTSSEYSD